MKVTILRLDRSDHVLGTLVKTDTFETDRVSLDPGKRFAVAEPYPGILFVAVRVVSCEDDCLTGEYVGYHYDSGPDVPVLYRHSVSWDHIGFGFCKLKLWAPELYGPFEKTVKRFWFDRELYEKCRRELHGSEEEGEDPDTRAGR